jgi:pimeloyl-ACP methyl ester carboxylesterase/uncharacterized protein (DUF1330 family)
MPAYVIANLTERRPGDDAARYLARIDDVVAAHGGRFLVHGSPPTVLEGTWTGDTVVVEFTDVERARAWYASDAYREILPLRLAQFEGPVVLHDGVPDGHRSTDLLTGPARPRATSVTTRDGVRLALDDLGDGPPVVLVHGWTLDRSAWEHQVAALSGEHRCVAYDRRGHGRSAVPGDGYDADTFADDLAEVLVQLDLEDVTLVAHSMGCGDVVRYLRRHGAGRVARIVLLAPTTPRATRAPDFPEGAPPELVAAGRAAFVRDRAAWFAERRDGYFRRADAPPGAFEAVADHTVRACLATPPHVALACMDLIATEDFRADLAAVAVPTLVLQGDADESTPLEATGRPTVDLLPQGRLRVLPGAGHGLYVTHQDEVAGELRRFVAEGTSA